MRPYKFIINTLIVVVVVAVVNIVIMNHDSGS